MRTDVTVISCLAFSEVSNSRIISVSLWYHLTSRSTLVPEGSTQGLQALLLIQNDIASVPANHPVRQQGRLGNEIGRQSEHMRICSRAKLG